MKDKASEHFKGAIFFLLFVLACGILYTYSAATYNNDTQVIVGCLILAFTLIGLTTECISFYYEYKKLLREHQNHPVDKE